MPTTSSAPSQNRTATAAVSNQVQPYLFFYGRADEAIEFYRRALGAEVTMLMRFKDAPDGAMNNPDCPLPPGFENKIMHASFKVGATEILASDGGEAKPAKFDGFALSLTVATVAQAESYFKALADGGQINAPLTKTFFSPAFGMVADRFGVQWMVYVKPGA